MRQIKQCSKNGFSYRVVSPILKVTVPLVVGNVASCWLTDASSE